LGRAPDEPAAGLNRAAERQIQKLVRERLKLRRRFDPNLLAQAERHRSAEIRAACTRLELDGHGASAEQGKSQNPDLDAGALGGDERIVAGAGGTEDRE